MDFSLRFYGITKHAAMACSIACMLMSSCLYSQNSNFCGQAEVMNNWFKSHPEDKVLFELAQQQLAGAAALQQAKNTQAAAIVPVYTVPVVFHILHLGGAENISDAQVHDQMTIFNKMFQKLNPDTINVIPSFTNNIANVQFEFRLATIDPDGNCTNGIIRHYTPLTDWDSNDFSAFIYTWPRDKYLNIYIVRSIDIAPAYTFLPGTAIPASADVIVCEHSICGSIGTSNGLNSWALGHEAAHWFNIPHIWGVSNLPGVACGDDGIADTPVTKGFMGCNPANSSVCNPPVIENFQNYMDYSTCKHMFTNGQKTHMHACINSPVNSRNTISSPSNLLATGITSPGQHCLPQLEVVALPSATLCAGKPIVANAYTCNADPTAYLWSATNGASISNPAIANPTLTFAGPGNYTVTCTVSNPNGSASASVVLTAVNGAAQHPYTYQESFEGASVPVNWKVLDPSTPAAHWDIMPFAGSHGNQSAFVNTENTPGGSIEILQTPSYDFLNNPVAAFTFRYAYALYSSTHKDVFKVQASKDCGGTWKDVYVPSASNLASGSGGISSSLFVPLPEQWKTYNVAQHPNFFSFLSQPNVIFRFYFKEDSVGFGNRIYIDQINFDSPLGINEFTRSISLAVYPNPVSENLHLSFVLSDPKKLKLKLFTNTGSVVQEETEKSYETGEHDLVVNMNNRSSGVYFLEMSFDGLKTVRKLIVE